MCIINFSGNFNETKLMKKECVLLSWVSTWRLSLKIRIPLKVTLHSRK